MQLARPWTRRLSLVASLAVLSSGASAGLAVPAATAAPTRLAAGAAAQPAPAPPLDPGVTVARVSEPPETPAADGELLSRRTERSRTFQQPDGSLRSVLGDRPLNYTDKLGQLSPIDTTLVRPGAQQPGAFPAADGAAFTTAAGRAVVSVPQRADGLLRVQNRDGSWVQTRLLGATGTPTATDSTATVAAALPGVTVGWTAVLGGLKETLTLASAAAISSYNVALSVSDGLTPALTSQGDVQVRDRTGTTVWTLPAPFMDDAAGAHSTAVRYALAAQPDGGWLLQLTADRGWLTQPARRFPVVVDPTVLLSGTGSGNAQDLACELRSTAPSTGYCTAPDLTVGTGADTTISRGAVKFPQLNQVVPANAIVATAGLELPVTAAEGTSPLTVVARPLTSPFTVAATWDTSDGAAGWPGGAGAVGAAGDAVATKTLPAAPVGTTAVLSVSDLTRRWLTGQTPNYGLLLQSSDETAARRATFAGLTSPCTVSSCGTRLSVSYVERLGKYQGSEFFDTDLTDSSQLSVNLITGNAVLTADDLGVTRTWNSKRTERVGQIGRGWNWGHGRDVRAWMQTGDKDIRYYAPDGGLYMFFRNSDGSYTSPPGLEATATAGSGNTVTITFLRTKTRLTFGGGYGQLQTSKDNNGNTTSYAYTSTLAPRDGVPFSTTVTDPAGRTLTATNNGRFVTDVTDAAARATRYDYGSSGDAADWLTTVTAADGATTTYGYDGSGRIKRITTPAGRVVRLAYDSGNRVTSLTRVSDPAGDGGLGSGPTTTFTYTPITADPTSLNPITPDARGTTTVTDPRGNTTTYSHDAAARVTQVLDPLGRHTDRDFTWDNKLTADYAGTTSTGKGSPTTYRYDNRLNPSRQTAPTGAATAASYASTAQPYLPDTTTDEQGNTTRYSYDPAGNLLSSATGDATTGTSTSYGVYGNPGVEACGGRTGQTGQVCTQTDGNGNVTRNTYDSSGNLASVTPPAPLGPTRHTYDTLGRAVSKTDGNGQTTRTSYDGLDRVTQVQFGGATTCTATDISAGKCISYGYDADGNLTSQADQTGTTSYGYDLLGRQTSKTLPAQTAQTLSYDAADNLTAATDAGGTTSYGYDAANQLISLAEPGGSCTTSPTVRCTTFGYNANGQRTSTTYPTSPATTVMTVTPDASGRVKQTRAVTGTTVQSDFTYTYASNTGSDTALTTSRTDNTTGLTTSYGYDTLDQLTGATEKDSGGTRTATWAYGYDKAGNRTSATIGGGQNTFGYNAANELISRNDSTAGFGYDANGNETGAAGATNRTNSWNNKDQLVSLSTGSATIPFGYTDASQNERTSRGGTTFTTSPTGLATETASGTTTSYVRDPAGTLVAERVAGNSYYYLFDGLGSVVGLVDSAGSKVNSYSYDPYGISRSKTEQVANPWQYTGGYLDADTGLYKLGIRYYDPTLGRFTQPDPTGQDPHYTYALNNPSSLTDPQGSRAGCDRVPDQYLSADFTFACARHDSCYARASLSQYACDRQFLSDLQSSCNATYGRKNPLRYACRGVAREYYVGVRLIGERRYDPYNRR